MVRPTATVGSHTVVADIPNIKSWNEKFSLSSQKPVTRGLTAANKFDPGGNFPISWDYTIILLFVYIF